MRQAILAAIRFYQRYISPYKGFHCAYRVHTGHASCSAFGYRAVRRHGVFGGLQLIRERTYRCGVVHRRYRETLGHPVHGQRGVCDVGCDLPCDPGCHLPHGIGLSDACDLLSCCDCGGCDWPGRKQRQAGNEKYVRIAPKVRSRVEPGRKQNPPGKG